MAEWRWGAISVFALLLAVGCSDSTEPIEPAELEVTIGGDWLCGVFSCEFRAEGRNLGPGCAREVRGVVRFYSGQAQLGTAREWQLDPTRVLGGGEAFIYEVADVSMDIAGASTGFTAEATWINVRC